MKADKIVCPVDTTLSLFNKKWSIQILRDMFFGKKHFSEFKEDKPNLSNKILSSCLRDLEDKGLIVKEVLNTTPTSTAYYLTDYGRSLNKVIYELAMFALDSDRDKFYSDEVVDDLRKTFRQTLGIDD